MTFDLELLDNLVTAGWLRRARHPEADLWIYNYTERAQYENHWTPETLACRGLILDAAGGIIARPFPKFFNHGTPQAGPVPDGRFIVTEKIDGSLGIVYDLDGEQHIATRGSFTSEQAVVGTRMLREQRLEPTPHATTLFEIVYPENRIVVDYGDRAELVLLGAVEKATGRDARLPMWSGRTVSHYGCDTVDELDFGDERNREGFVLTWPDAGHRRKIKLDEYVRLHRVVTGINARSVWESMRDGDDLDGLLQGVPDEIFDWVTRTRTDLLAAFNDEADRALQVYAGTPDGAHRREIAEYYKASGANTAVLFRMVDLKPYDDLIWKAIKPAAGVYPGAATSGRSSGA